MINNIPLIYIAGPFRGPTPLAVRRNVEAARDAGLLVAEETGAYPVIPHTMTSEFDKQLTDQFWLDGTLALLVRCDGIFLLDNWAQSKGATIERQWAIDHNMPIFMREARTDGTHSLTTLRYLVRNGQLCRKPWWVPSFISALPDYGEQ